MDNETRFVKGIDVGSEMTRAVAATVDENGLSTVVGFSEVESSGMRKGVPANLTGPAATIDAVLKSVEQMSGREVNSAYLSIGGAQILTTRTEGMIAVGAMDHEISGEDLDRVEAAAVTGKISPNREILDVVPLEYALDGQGGIRDPLGMNGSRLEMRACAFSALKPNVENLKKAADGAGVTVERLIPGAVAAARAVLSDKQKENGVAVIDLGAATTSIAVYEEGDLQYVGVVPVGSNNITNDLAIVLQINPEMAEEIKRRYITGDFEKEKSHVIRVGKEERVFERKEVEEVAKARLAEIFEEVRKKLKAAKYDQRLPEGMVLTGGGARMRDIEVFAREALEAAVRVGKPDGMAGMTEEMRKPEWATAVGLVLTAAEENLVNTKKKKVVKKGTGGGFLKKLWGKI